jgi:hypothetical protein
MSTERDRRAELTAIAAGASLGTIPALPRRYEAAGYQVLEMEGSAFVRDVCLVEPNDSTTPYAEKRREAERIAAALNDAREFPWIGDGPTLEEAGQACILIRAYGVYGAAHWTPNGWVFSVSGAGVTDAKGWRRMPAAPGKGAHDATAERSEWEPSAEEDFDTVRQGWPRFRGRDAAGEAGR